MVGRPINDIRASAADHSDRAVDGVISTTDARAIAKSSDNVGECNLAL